MGNGEGRGEALLLSLVWSIDAPDWIQLIPEVLTIDAHCHASCSAL